MLFTTPLPIVLASVALAAAQGSIPGLQVGIAINFNGNAKKCLDVRDAKFADGTPVQIFDCNGTPAQKWVIERGGTRVRVANTNFCLDAGPHPGNFVHMTIVTCRLRDNVPEQDWFYTADNRIALKGQGLCLDLPSGDTTNRNPIQTFKCTDKDTNQIWTTPINFKPELPSDDAAQPEPQVHWEIHPNGNNKKCIDVKDGKIAAGTPVQIFDCNEARVQRWVIHRGDIQVRLQGTPFCLAVDFVGDFSPVRIQPCSDFGVQLQHWFYTADNRIALKDQHQCLDLPNGNTNNGTPLQTFRCTTGDTNQIWTTTPPIPPSLGLDTQSFRVQGDKSGFCA